MLSFNKIFQLKPTKTNHFLTRPKYAVTIAQYKYSIVYYRNNIGLKSKGVQYSTVQEYTFK